MLGIDRETVSRDIKTITSRIRDFENVDEYLRNTIERIGEQLTQLDELVAEQFALLDWCKEEVVQVGGPFNAPVAVVDPATGEPLRENGKIVYEMGPRKPSGVIAATAQIAALLKQRAELLKLVGPKVDISINLNLALRAQALIMERLRTAAPEVYQVLYRELEVLRDNPTGGDQLALTDGVIDAEFREEHADVEEINDGEVD